MSVKENVAESFRRIWGPQGSIGRHISLRSLALALLGIGMLIVGTLLTPAKNPPENVTAQPPKNAGADLANRSYEEVLEGKLANQLSRIQGVGAVLVAISLEGGPQQEYAYNTVRENKVIQEQDNTGGTRVTTETKENEQVLVSREGGADRPVIAREVKPQIRGVLIVAEGADNSQVKAQLMQAVEAGLGIPSYKITVLPQKR